MNEPDQYESESERFFANANRLNERARRSSKWIILFGVFVLVCSFACVGGVSAFLYYVAASATRH